MQVREYRDMSAVRMPTCCHRAYAPNHWWCASLSDAFSTPNCFFAFGPQRSNHVRARICCQFATFIPNSCSLGPWDTSGTRVPAVLRYGNDFPYPCVIPFECWGFVPRLNLISIGARARRPRRGKWWLSGCLYQAKTCTGEGIRQGCLQATYWVVDSLLIGPDTMRLCEPPHSHKVGWRRELEMAVHQTGFEGSAGQPRVSYLAAFELTYSIYAPPQLSFYT
jgi:hypothetical protein